MSTLGVIVVSEGGPGAGAVLGGLSLLDRAVAVVRGCPDVDHVVVLAPGQPPPDAAHAGADVVVLHDVSFPLVDAATVAAVLGALQADPAAAAAVAVLPVTDTLKQVDPDGTVLGTVDRSGLRVAGSPQAFRPHLVPVMVRAEVPAPLPLASPLPPGPRPFVAPPFVAPPFVAPLLMATPFMATPFMASDAAALPRALVEANRRVVLVDAPPSAFRVRSDLDLLAARALLGESV